MGDLNIVSPISTVTPGTVIRTDGETLAYDRKNLVSTASGPATVKLPTEYDDSTYVIVEDSSGDAAAHPITVDGNGQTIDGRSAVEIATAYGALAFGRDAARGDWTILTLPRQLDGTPAIVRIYQLKDLAQAVAALSGATPHVVPPPPGDWTLVQANGLTNLATLEEQPGGALAFTWEGDGSDGAGEPVRLAYKDAPTPGANGYRVVAHARTVPLLERGNAYTLRLGVGFRQSSDGSIETLEYILSAGPARGLSARRRYTPAGAGATGPSPNYGVIDEVIGSYPIGQVPEIWVRVTRTNAGDRSFAVSFDGRNWENLSAYASSGNDFITPDQVFLQATIYDDAGDALGGVVFDSYQEEAF